MPVVKGRVGEKSVNVLRDTGCSGIVVKKDLVSEDQFTGDFNVMLLIDNTARKVPIAKIDVDTPYLKGQMEAQCLPDPIYDLVVGNVPGARAADDPDPSWQDHVQEEQVRGVEREEAMKHMQNLLSDERRRLSNVRDALDKEMRLIKQLEEKLSIEKLLKSEVERKLAEVTKAKESLQRELKKDKNLMCETTNELRDREDSARQRDEVYEEVKSELTTPKGNRVQREGKQFTVPENVERLERLDGEINPIISKVPAKKVRVVEATTVGAVAVGMETTNSKRDCVEVQVEEVVDDVNFLETDGYVAKESVKDVAVGDNVCHMQSTGVT